MRIFLDRRNRESMLLRQAIHFFSAFLDGAAVFTGECTSGANVGHEYFNSVSMELLLGNEA